MAMIIHGVSLTCLLSLICYITVQAQNSSNATTERANTTELTPVTTMLSSNSTAVGGLQTLQTSEQNVLNESTTSTTSGPEGNSMSSIVMTSNTSLSTSTPDISIPSVTSSSTEKNASTTEMQTTLSNATLITAGSPVTATLPETPQTVATTEMLTNTTSNFTQTATLDHTTFAPTLQNASTSIPATSGDVNVTVSTGGSTNETSAVVTPNVTSANTSSTIETSINATVSVTATMPMSATNEAMTHSTEVSNSTWSTAQSPKTSATPAADHCTNAICPPGTKCVNIFMSYKCQCPPGFFNVVAGCTAVRIFPGILHLQNATFTDDLKEINSRAFYEMATKTEKEMKGFFKNITFYYKSVVRKFTKGSINVFVDNVFEVSSTATKESVSTVIRNGIEKCTSCDLISRADTFNVGSVCSLNPCDNSTSQCKANNGIAICNCMPGYFKYLPSDRSCKACLSGFKFENGTCVKCPFGYGGFNCDKSYLLVVVVVSCVLGGIILLLLLALITTCLRSKSGSCSSSSGSHDYVMWPKSEMPKIPRATMHWDGNQLEMQENGSTSSLNDIHRDGRTPEKNDDLKTFKGKQQSRYTYLCQGQENPYYVSDEKKPEFL
ncbi:protein HEG-like isoform X2 [Scyliorhinus canicula]|uniref:protein HEG-like isoform X2 n=1 Tax=Scyliorhinus canicula TaxID=7830 RepID=UPI0018F7A4AE|nr:protein HEG-like isoform X2 [Scyliorhinus canicula]